MVLDQKRKQRALLSKANSKKKQTSALGFLDELAKSVFFVTYSYFTWF